MAADTGEYSGLHRARCSLIQLLTLLYIALCIPQPLKVFCAFTQIKARHAEIAPFPPCPPLALNKNVVNRFTAGRVVVCGNRAGVPFCTQVWRRWFYVRKETRKHEPCFFCLML